MSLQPSPGQFSLTDTLRAAWDIMLGRPDGLKRMDLTDNGFWLSFWALGLTAMIDATIYSLRFPAHKIALQSVQPSKLWYIVGNLSISFLAYGVAMLALYLLCRTPNEQRRFPYAIIVNNWASPLISIMVLLLTILSLWGMDPTAEAPMSDFWMLFSLMFFVAIIYASTNLLRISLDISGGRALSYVVVTTIISVIFSLGLERMAGFSV